MKNILQLLINISIWYSYSFRDFFLILWYGKLPKVSTYHRVKKDYPLNEIFNDELAQSKQNKYLDKQDILDVIYEICKDCDELPNNIPIRDNKGKVYGSQGLYSYLENLIKQIK